jgi:two-component system phosphate regulon sensor histidine kinase PhoR
VIESVLEHLEPQIEKRNINVHLELTDVIGKGIVSVTEEILYNLIENAVKYNKADGLLTVRLSQNVHFIHIEVEDTGIGISEEDLPRIYERFYRSDKSHSHQIEGSGLGLSIVKHGLFLLNGEIKVESTLHQGTKFTIDLKKHA